MKVIFNSMSLLKKLTLAYTVAILIPTISIGSYTYYLSQKRVMEDETQSSLQMLSQIKDDISYKILIAHNIVENLAYNYIIQSFLSKDFSMSADAVLDEEEVYSMVDYAKNFNSAIAYKISIYMKNNSIPEIWHNLYREKRIERSSWYRKVISEDSSSVWLGSHSPSLFDTGKPEDKNMVFSLIKKIYGVNGKYLGLIVLDILREEIFLSVNNADTGENIIYVIGKNGDTLFPLNVTFSKTEFDLFKKYAKNKNGHLIQNNNLYVYESIEPLDVKIISRIPLKKIVKNVQERTGSMLLVIILGVVLLEGFTYFILQTIFSGLRKIVNVMDKVAGGNFAIRIPIDRSDEVGQMAEHFNVLIAKINGLIDDVYKKEIAHRNARIKALQYQINPHFIYNTLDSFHMKMELAEEYETAEAIINFSEILRYTTNSESMYAKVKDELQYLKNYTDLQKLKYGNRIHLTVDIPIEIEQVEILKFILQPLLENSIRHGLVSREQHICIRIIFEVTGEILRIVVTDDGAGIDERNLDELNDKLRYCQYDDGLNEDGINIGLLNINYRIKLFYGDQYFIQLKSKKGEYTSIDINIPYKRN